MNPERLKKLNELAKQMLDIYLEDSDESPFIFKGGLRRDRKPTDEIVLVSIIIRKKDLKIKAAALPAVSGSQPTMQTCECCGGSGLMSK